MANPLPDLKKKNPPYECAGDDGSNRRKADTSEFLFFFQTYCCSQKAAGPQMVQAENTRYFSAPKWDYQPPSISFALSKWSGACLAAPCPGRVPRNFPPLRRRQCGGGCPRLQASRGESPGVPTGKVPGRRRRAPQWAGRAPEKKRRETQREGKSAQEDRESALTDQENVPTDRESAPAADRTVSRNRSIAPKAHSPQPGSPPQSRGTRSPALRMRSPWAAWPAPQSRPRAPHAPRPRG